MENKVLRTENYDMFNKLLGNRDVNENNVSQIMKSVRAKGYHFSPIIVNEKMEVIDGQHRLEAFKRLGIPIDYIINEGGTVEDCNIINSTRKGWSVVDHIKSYAEQGSHTHQELLKLISEYSCFAPSVVVSVALGWSSWGSCAPQRVGDFGKYIDDKELIIAKAKLDWLMQMKDTIISGTGKGGHGKITTALAILYEMPEINCERMVEKMQKYYSLPNTPKFATVKDAYATIDYVYNYRAAERVDINALYRSLVEKARKANVQNLLDAQRRRKCK